MAHSLKSILDIHKKTKGKGFSKNSNSTNELEVRFGTRQKQKMNRLDFNRVISKLKSCGFTCDNQEGTNTLKIFNDDSPTIRVEIESIKAIQNYCKTNSFEHFSLFSEKFEKL